MEQLRSPFRQTLVRILHSLDEISPDLQRCAVTIGNFDGVHRGHAHLIDRVKHWAQACGGPAVALTFDPHPLGLLRPDSVPLPLTTLDRKLELLASTGVDAVLVYPTDTALLALSPTEFFERIVRDRLQARVIVEGPNFYFGRGRAGNIDTLRELALAAGMEVEIVPPLVDNGELVSSSRVRETILAGRIGLANSWLTAPYRLAGRVGTGAARGRTIGFPTANLVEVNTIIPKEGVYIARTTIADRQWPCAVNIGPNPTFQEQARKIEVHVIGFSGDLYGQPLALDFFDRLRDVQTFGSVAELVDQLRRDVAEASEACRCGGFVR